MLVYYLIIIGSGLICGFLYNKIEKVAYQNVIKNASNNVYIKFPKKENIFNMGMAYGIACSCVIIFSNKVNAYFY